MGCYACSQSALAIQFGRIYSEINATPKKGSITRSTVLRSPSNLHMDTEIVIDLGCWLDDSITTEVQVNLDLAR